MGRPSIFSCFREKVAKGSELEKKGPGQKSSKSKSSLAKEMGFAEDSNVIARLKNALLRDAVRLRNRRTVEVKSR